MMTVWDTKDRFYVDGTESVLSPRRFISTPGSCGQIRPYQTLRLSPHAWIAFNLGVGLPEDAIVPRVFGAIIWALFVVESKIPDDSRACRIGCANGGLAVEKSTRLIEIGRLGYVPGNERIIMVNLRDTIHLNGEEHGNAILLQFTCQGDGFRAAPAMPINDDVSILFLAGA